MTGTIKKRDVRRLYRMIKKRSPAPFLDSGYTNTGLPSFSEIKYASKAALPKLPIPYCDREMPSIEGRETFRKANNLTYPINVARNTARQAANTHYVLPSDIELYPNPGLIRGFLKMVTSFKEEAINQR